MSSLTAESSCSVQVMHQEWHATNLQQTSYTKVIEVALCTP